MFSPQDHKGSTTSHNGHIGNEEHKPRNGRQQHAICKRKGGGVKNLPAVTKILTIGKANV